MDRPHATLLMALSLSRIILGCIALLIFRADNVTSSIIVSLVFTISQATDHLDGYVARNFSTPTISGYVQDSLGDKAFQFAMVLAVCREFDLHPLIPWISFLREASVLSIRIVKNFSHSTLQKLRPWSIAYATLVRGAVVALVVLPAADYYGGAPKTAVISLSLVAFCASIIPAAIGILISIKSS